MKIINKTDYRLSHLRAICHRIGKYQLEPDRLKRLQITIIYREARGWEPKELEEHTDGYGSRGCSGYAYLNSNVMVIRLPRTLLDRIDLAMVIAHEMAHTRGMTHAEMRNHPQYRLVGVWRTFYAWAESMPMEKYPVKVKPEPKPKPIPEPVPKKPVQIVRFEKLSDQYDRWLKKFKRAENALAKLRPKISYYKKALAGKGLEPSIAMERPKKKMKKRSK